MTAHRYRFQNPAVLGTVVEFSFEVTGHGEGAVDDPAADHRAEMVADALFGELDRLQAVFSAFDDSSELCLWRSGALPGTETSEEFAALMGPVLAWQRWSGGLFNPLTGELSAVWAEAEREGREPDPDRLLSRASSIAEARFEMVDGHPIRTGDCSRFNLNAVAKGWIVDRAIAGTAERFDDIDNLLVNAGGDLRHRGSGTARVGIENPQRPYDNEPPVAVIEITDEAVATSGASRRAFRVAGRRIGHVLDPRTGQPAEVSASVSIVAPSAMVADVVATPAGILPPAEALELVDRAVETAGVAVAALIIDHDGTRHPSRRWRERFGPHEAPTSDDAGSTES
ncbi:MAG: FAD:protein FMN transferase [Acidimicrobiia bacterium]|nr:FAD:protein FMN transferase [Acidimicrobiia bacterium]MDH5522362.1 FAD:protein FMN transferase [Acidimicrobiia bacterium]